MKKLLADLKFTILLELIVLTRGCLESLENKISKCLMTQAVNSKHSE